MVYEHLSREANNSAFDAAKFVTPKDSLAFPSYKPNPGTGLWASEAGAEFNWKKYCDEEINWTIRSEFKFMLSQAARVITVSNPADISKIPIRKFDRWTGFDWFELTKIADALVVEDAVLRETEFVAYSVPSLLVLNPTAVVPFQHSLHQITVPTDNLPPL